MADMTVVISIFEDEVAADAAVASLKDAGVTLEDLEAISTAAASSNA